MKNGVEDFVVESTPVLDLKKQGLPTQGVNKDVIWDSDRTEVYSDAEGDTSVASLIGEQGEIYPITTFPFAIGRGSECDLVLQGKGVSRRHAEIIFQAGRFVVNDLESLNGIKVNGYKVARVILEENDAIRLGEVSLVFRSRAAEGGGYAPAKEGKSRRSLFGGKPDAQAADNTFGPSPAKKLATHAAVLVAIALAGFAGYQYWINSSQPKGRILDVTSGAPVAQAGSAQAGSAQADASATASAAGSQTTQEPAAATASTNGEPGSATSVTDDATSPPPSLAAPAVAAPIVAAKPVTPAKPVATRTEKVEKPVAKASAAKPAVAKAKPVAAPAPRQQEIAAAPRSSRVPVSAQQDLTRAQDLYFKGDAQAAINVLKPALENTSLPASLRAEIRTAYTNYSTLYNQYGAGQSAWTSGDKTAAFQTWNAFMDKEAALFGGRKSSYTRNISSRVLGEYVTLGNEAARNGDHHKAYRLWQKALELGDNVAARIAIDNANNKAIQLYRQALRLEYVNASKAKALWKEVTELLPPGTEYHTKASAKLAWYERWGT